MYVHVYVLEYIVFPSECYGCLRNLFAVRLASLALNSDLQLFLFALFLYPTWWYQNI